MPNTDGALTRRRFALGATCAPLLTGCAFTQGRQESGAPAQYAPREPAPASLTDDDRAFLDDLRRRAFRFFVEQADPDTGLVRDRSLTTGEVQRTNDRDTASIASTGFGLAALCIGAENGWIAKDKAREHTLKTLHFFRERAPSERGWYYHFLAGNTGERRWKSELSSIDTALLMAGVITGREYFENDREIASLADQLYERIDFRWMLNGHPHLLSMGWFPEKGFLDVRWKHYCELAVLYILGIGAPKDSLPAESWYAWERPRIEYAGYRYIYGDRPLFVHQFSHAWIDFRGLKEDRAPHLDWFRNSVIATLAHRQYCADLSKKFPAYSPDMWGITASDSAKGYVAWGGPPLDDRVDGTVVPCAAAGSLMFTPRESLDTLEWQKQLHGKRIWGHYGFTDAFNPNTGWVNADVIGIDVGITLLSAENLVNGNVWKWFMKNQHIREGMKRAGLVRA